MPATTILCQARRHGRIHGARLAVFPGRAEPTEQLLSDLRFVPDGHHGAWCRSCERVTVYRIVAQDNGEAA